jgi:hypothetical protein
MASFATRLFGSTTRLPDLVRIFVARHVTCATRPSKFVADIQWPTRNGLSS